MKSSAAPDFFISPARELTMPEITFFYVTNQPTEFANLDRDLDPLLENLYTAKANANIAEAGPDIVRYYKADQEPQTGGPGLYWMEVGIPVKPETRPAGDARVKTLPPFSCAGVLLWGSLAHIGQAYETLTQALKALGLKHMGECREWNYRFESVDSPNNLMGIYMEVCQE